MTWPPVNDYYYCDDYTCIIHGDCKNILPELPPIDLCLTDPPYNAKNIGPNHRVYVTGIMQLPAKEYQEFCTSWFKLCNNAKTIVFSPGIANTHYYPQPKWQICWHKPAAKSFNRMGGFNAWEPFFVYGDTKHVKLGQDYLLFNTLNFSKGHEREHPCPKPLALVSRLVSLFSQTDDLICDPMCGSGTTLRAAKDLGRKSIGIEIEECYAEIAAKRMRQEVLDLTGK